MNEYAWWLSLNVTMTLRDILSSSMITEEGLPHSGSVSNMSIENVAVQLLIKRDRERILLVQQ